MLPSAKLLRLIPRALSLLVAATLLTALPALAVDKDIAEMERYTLTMDKLNRFGQVMSDLGAYVKAHPESKAAIETDAEKHEDLDAITRRISSVPGLVSILNKDGLPPREFVLVEVTLIQAAMAFSMKPADEPDARYAAKVQMNPANLAFVRDHQAEIKAMQAKMSPDQ